MSGVLSYNTIPFTIRKHDPDEGPLLETNDINLNTGGYQTYLPGLEATTVQEEPNDRRDQIAEAMWRDYQAVLAERNCGSEDEDDFEEFSSDDEDDLD